jgi:DinB family protein
MDFSLSEAVPVLERTPRTLHQMLGGLPGPWVTGTEGPDRWSPYDVVGHLIHGERTDWIPRTEIMLQHGDAVAFPPFDRFAQFAASRGKSLAELLDEFAHLRAASLERLAELRLQPADLGRRGRHPELGPVTLGQHLATWVAHDLSHIAQISRVMAKQYTLAVGPWRAYLPLLGTA